MSPLDRIRKLVALAGSTNENEARNAAVQACKLITEHKIVLSMPGQQASGDIPLRNVRTGVNPTQSAEDVMRNGEPVDLSQAWKGIGNIVDTILGPDAGSRFRNHVNTPPDTTLPVPMTAPQDGTCRDCGEGFARGERVWYKRGVGAVHTMKCNPDVLTRKRPSR